MSLDTTLKLPGLTLGQQRSIAKIKQARRQADIEAAGTVVAKYNQHVPPSQRTLRPPTPRPRRQRMQLPIIDAQPQSVAIAAGWPQWLLGLVLLMLLFVGASLMSMAHDPRGNVEATTGWTDTPVLP